jgi:phosphoribosylformylglycinamidine synthase subunit PurL
MKQLWGLPPALDMDYERRVQAAIREVVNAGLAESSHDLGDGGLGVALAECCSAGMGASIHLATELRPEFALFHEGPSRILISTSDVAAVHEIATRHRVGCLNIGVTMKERLRIDNEMFQGESARHILWIDQPVARLRDVWENALEHLLAPVHV